MTHVLSVNLDRMKKRRRHLLYAFVLIMAASFSSASHLVAEDANFTVLKRWQTDNETLRPTTYEDGVLYLAGENTAEAWNTETGERLWVYALDTSADFRPRLAGDLVLILGRRFITALDRKTGQKRWTLTPEREDNAAFEPVAAPFFHDGYLYLGINSNMSALDLDGNIVWQRPTVDKKGIWYAPTVYQGDTVLFGPGDGLLHALDAKTGETRWTIDNAEKWQYLRQLHVSNETVVAGGYKDNLFGIDAQGGKVAWSWYSGNFINSHLVYGGAAYLWSPTGWVYAIEAKNGSVKWRTKTDYFPKKSGKKRPWAPVMAELVADDHGLYVLDMANVIHIHAHATGREISTLSFSERLRPFVSLVPNENELFVGTVSGEIMHVRVHSLDE